MKKPKNWDNDAEFGSDILGTGSYQFTGAADYESEMKHTIGFVRPSKSLIIQSEKSVGRKRLSVVLNYKKK